MKDFFLFKLYIQEIGMELNEQQHIQQTCIVSLFKWV